MEYLIEIKTEDGRIVTWWQDEQPDILELESKFPKSKINITPYDTDGKTAG